MVTVSDKAAILATLCLELAHAIELDLIQMIHYNLSPSGPL